MSNQIGCPALEGNYDRYGNLVVCHSLCSAAHQAGESRLCDNFWNKFVTSGNDEELSFDEYLKQLDEDE